jgi:uncharacterized protein
MTINVSEALKSEGAVFHASLVENFHEISYLGSVYRYCSPVALETEYVYTGTRLVFRGHLNTSLKTECSRCLEQICFSVDLPFEEVFSKTDTDAYEIDGEIVSLDRMVEDNIVLNLPGRFLCKEDCRGLCPVCGANLNQRDCGCKCRPEPNNNPFAVLQKLLDENKEV